MFKFKLPFFLKQDLYTARVNRAGHDSELMKKCYL